MGDRVWYRLLTPEMKFLVETVVFDRFSKRSQRVIFFARLAAGRRMCAAPEARNRAAALDCEHLLEGILLDDDPKRLRSNDAGFEVNPSFFADNIATKLLSELGSKPSFGVPIPEDKEPHVCPRLHNPFLYKFLENTLFDAEALAAKTQHRAVEPLHLLAAILMSNTPVSEQLRQQGVTLETVLAALESGNFF